MKAKFYFATWIFTNYFLIGTTNENNLKCQIVELIDGLMPVCHGGLGFNCCRWKSDTGKNEKMCCPELLGCPPGYDWHTCYIQQCYLLSISQDCDEDTFKSYYNSDYFNLYDKLPAGANSVDTCCHVDNNGDIDRFCCITVGEKTICNEGDSTDNCPVG